jgi:hypothetical protein
VHLPTPRRLKDDGDGSALSPAELGCVAYDLRLGKEAGMVSLLFDDEVIWLVGPYDPAFNARLKAALPAPQRWWEPERRMWAIASGRYKQLVALIEEEYGAASYQLFFSAAHVDRLLETLTGQSPPAKQAEWYKTLFLQPGAPPALVDAVYRQLAKLYHPDVGGDLRTMQAINEAYARIKQTSTARGVGRRPRK